MSVIEMPAGERTTARWNPPWAPPRGRRVGLDSTPLPRELGIARRALRHRRAMHYNRLIGAVSAVNVAIATWMTVLTLAGGSDVPIRHLALVAQANFVLAALPRQQWLINAIGWLATRPGHRWPLRVRWALGKYYHLGGVHVGAAIAGTAWYLVFVVAIGRAFVRGDAGISLANVVVAASIVLLFLAMVLMAMPEQRRAHHDRFEITHRFLAWGSLVLVWGNTLLFVHGQRNDRALLGALATSPTVWLLLLTTAFAVWPWLLLRKVPITVDKPSDHVAIVHLDHGVTPGVGTTRPISRHPLVGWHHFGCVPAPPGRRGYRMAISRAGDWTGDFIDSPPDHVWVRGLPAVGVANVRRLFRRVLFVATGSGIGPALSHLLDSGPDCRLVWITRDPTLTYGTELVGEIMRAQPDAIVWNSDQLGKPDVLRLAYGAAVEFDAEAVICISNKAITWSVVEGLEQRGIPAFGPIWDS